MILHLNGNVFKKRIPTKLHMVEATDLPEMLHQTMNPFWVGHGSPRRLTPSRHPVSIPGLDRRSPCSE